MSFDADRLLQRIQVGDEEAERELIIRFEAGVELLLRSRIVSFHDRQDVAQEIFIALLKSAREGGIKEPAKLNAFIRSLSLNVIADYFRGLQRRQNNFVIQDESQVVFYDADPVLEEEAARAMRRLLAELPTPRDREILFRYYLSEENKDKICDALNLSARHFHRVMGRARTRFRRLLEKKLGTLFDRKRTGSKAQIAAAAVHHFDGAARKKDHLVR